MFLFFYIVLLLLLLLSCYSFYSCSFCLLWWLRWCIFKRTGWKKVKEYTIHMYFYASFEISSKYSTRFLLTAAYISLKCSNANTLCSERNGVDMELFQCNEKCWSVKGLVHMAREKFVGINEIDRKTTKTYSLESWDPVAHILYYIEKSSHISTAMV